MNSVCLPAVCVGPAYEEVLAQGTFLMADLTCKACSKQVGYKFVADRSRQANNAHQVGRFGLVTSCVALGHAEVPALAATSPPALPPEPRARADGPMHTREAHEPYAVEF